MRKIALLALLLLSASCSVVGLDEGIQDQLRDEKEAWVKLGLHDYTYELRVLCFCPNTDVAIVTVTNDSVTSVVKKADGTPVARFPSDLYRPIPALYDYLIDAAGRADEISATFDGNAHLPTRVEIDFIKNAADDEIALEVSNLQPR
jgi:hypothetical protein